MLNILSNKPSKVRDTTIASIYIAYSGLKHNIKTENILILMHDLWCRINAIFETYDVLYKKRENQYRKFSLLEKSEKLKDMIWINSIKNNIKEI